ncbi:MAG: hypothetical protein IPK05_18570 [Comamonadaceae bacterium]|nr:hypothetical protein [Comamonadaceae bacterium]
MVLHGPWRGTLALCALLMLAETGVALAVPWLAGEFAGRLFTGVAQAGGLLLVALLVLFAVQALLRFASSWLLGRTAEYILADLRTQCMTTCRRCRWLISSNGAMAKSWRC